MDTAQDNRETSVMNDHDLLITLNTKFNWLRGEIKNSQDGFISKVTDHESRLNVIEKVHDEINPMETVKIVKAHEQWIHDFKITYRNIIFMVSVIASVITFILTLIAKL